ncbi:hypothetical protein BC332_07959 [Capsicum chinense]|nr:hypothetical protein BC332_07959 [Capsicum chinense]
MKCVMRFGKKRKLSPRFIGPFDILQHVGPVAYELALLSGLSVVHPVFHVSMMKSAKQSLVRFSASSVNPEVQPSQKAEAIAKLMTRTGSFVDSRPKLAPIIMVIPWIVEIARDKDCKAKHDGVINAINALTTSIKKMASKRGVIPSKRISYPYTLLEIKATKSRRKDTSKASLSIEKSKLAMTLSLSCTIVQCKRATEKHHELKKVDVTVEATAKEHNIIVDNPSIASKKEEKVEPVRTDWSTIEAYPDKMGSPFDVQYIEGIAQQTIGSL